MQHRLVLSLFIGVVAFSLTARADTVFVKGREKGVKGDVKGEDATTVTLTVKKTAEKFAAADVLDIHYDDLSPIALVLAGGAYKLAKDAEKDGESADPAKRKAAWTTAISKYNETLKQMKAHPNAMRNIRYRIALLTLKQAQDSKASTANAVLELQRFRTDFPNSWQINHVMPLIAQVQMDANDFKAAAATFQDMADMESLPAEVRTSAEIMIVQVAVRSKDMAQAQKKLAALEVKAAGNPKFASRVKMTKAEVLVALQKPDEAMKLLQQVVKENTDKDIKALAHNTLGECLYNANRFNEARWEFLFVDTIFNQDKNQHAKALYYLWKTFQNLNDEVRAQECREQLLSAAFTGTEWQLKGQKEAGK